ncbi:T9SS type A sorting domain-containing protein [Spirosoma rhododendri]|uniref:T9SS type A sorting domain-containing protein n=1 Tax=Spirosoma rhododendri TaxID=2728024 RepID=A0A7L5DMN1_9BACT|nr:T9SS type A sorting domain-containing protein [Spirosoma rhododendri]QJD77317.1 T9SS type A sorting domain-containing protein [Spirosoma rhododendri]
MSVIWQNRYEPTRRFNDATNATDGQNYLITGVTTATLPSFAGILAIDPSGQPIQDLRSDRLTGDTYFFSGNALITPLPGSSPAQSVLLTTSGSSSRGNDFRLSTPGLTLSLGGTGDEAVSSLVTTPDGGFLLAGTTTSTDGEVQGKTDNTASGWIVKLAPVKPLTLNAPTYDCSTGAITFNVSGGDGSPITFSAPGISRPSLTSTTGTVEQGLRNDPKTIFIVANQSGQRATYSFDLKAFCSGTPPTTPTPTPNPPTTGGTLTLTQPTYNCSTGAITFNSTGGDGSIITYSAPGIMRSSVTSNTGVVEQGLRNDPKTILITAMQGGYSTSYSFDFKSFCSGNPTTPVTPTPPVTENGLLLTAPTYNCSTGAFTFNYTARNGSPVEFQAAGITGWTTNPNQFVDRDSRTANDVKPFTLMARQNGQVVTYTWDLKAACGRSARVAAEAGQGLQLTVKGNPVGNTAIVDISGVEGQAVQLDLLNASGHVLEQRHIEQAGVVEEQRFELQRQPTGVLFLRAQSGQQHQTVKLIKQ